MPEFVPSWRIHYVQGCLQHHFGAAEALLYDLATCSCQSTFHNPEIAKTFIGVTCGGLGSHGLVKQKESFGVNTSQTSLTRSPIASVFGKPWQKYFWTIIVSFTWLRICLMLIATAFVLVAATGLISIWQMFTRRRWDPRGQVACLGCMPPTEHWLRYSTVMWQVARRALDLRWPSF